MQPNPAVRIPNNNNTRILSVFSLLKRVGFAVLLLGSQAHAFDVIWNREGQSDSSRYGVWIIPLGDQNDDGFKDWGIFALGVRVEGPNHTYAEFFHGGNPPSNEPYMTWEYDADEVNYFRSARPIGDVNGDGFQDWVNGMQYTDQPDSVYYEIFFGGPSSDQEQDFTLSFLRSGVFPAYSVNGLGDFNGDSFDDIFVHTFHSASSRQGSVFFGDVLPDTEVDWTINAPPVPLDQPNFESYGNLNGDEFADFVTNGGFDEEDSLWVFHGGEYPSTLPAQSVHGLGGGHNAYIVGDMNGDELDDLLISRLGGMDVHWGGPTIHQEPNARLDMDVGGSGPSWVTGIGDVNQDGYADVGAINDFDPSGWGGFRLYLGSPWPVSNPTFSFNGRFNEWDLIGVYRTAGLGDVNGDGVDDFMVTGTNDDFDGYRGKALIFAGDTSYHVAAESGPILPDVLELSVYPNPFNSTTRITLTLPPHIHHAELRVHNLLGQEVLMRELNAENGHAEFALDGTNLATGVYLVSARAGKRIVTQKVMLLK